MKATATGTDTSAVLNWKLMDHLHLFCNHPILFLLKTNFNKAAGQEPNKIWSYTSLLMVNNALTIRKHLIANWTIFSSFSKFCNCISNSTAKAVPCISMTNHLYMSTEGKMSIFRLLNPPPHLPPPHTEQWQFRTIHSVCTTSTPKPHIWECLLLLPPYLPPISSGMTEPTCHEIAHFPLTTQTQHCECHQLLPLS